MLIPTWPVANTVKSVCFDKQDSATTILQTLPQTPILLKQIHGSRVLTWPWQQEDEADGCYSRTKNSLCAIKTADCQAIYLASTDGAEIALLHGGWRGLSQQIITHGLACFEAKPADIIAYLGPAISAPHYEIGTEVYDAFCQRQPSLHHAFQASIPGHYYCDLYAIARAQLQQNGVTAIYGGEYCTFSDPTRFHSFRRDNTEAGRLLHCLWLERTIA